jgi:broad specificity phosphatase PhoE
MHTFYLVRHAHTNWTSEESRPLSSKGMRDARRVADILEEHPITIVYSSPYTRACQTIETLVVKRGLGICMDERLRERELGHYQSISFEEAVRCTWQDMDFAFPGGETNRKAQARAIEWMQEMTHRETEGQILVGTHGNLLALMLRYFDPSVDYGFWLNMSMPDIYRLEVDIGEIARYERLWES